MFHACDVKIAKIAAHSGPSKLFGKSWIKPTTVIDNIPSTGIDWSISIKGISTFSAFLFFAASGATIRVTRKEKTKAMNMRKTVLRAYSGSIRGDREI